MTTENTEMLAAEFPETPEVGFVGANVLVEATEILHDVGPEPDLEEHPDISIAEGKLPKAKKAKKVKKEKKPAVFTVLDEGKLSQAISVRPDAAWLKLISGWDYRFFSWTQKDLMAQCANKQIKAKDVEALIIPMFQFRAAMYQSGPVFVDQMYENFKSIVDKNLHDLIKTWSTTVYEQHLTDIITKNTPFEFEFLVHVLNRFANEALVNRDQYDDSPIDKSIVLPMMFLDHGAPGEYRTPVLFVSAREVFTMFGAYVSCVTQSYKWVNGALRSVQGVKILRPWAGCKSLTDLGIQFSVTDSECAELSELGKKVIKLNQEPSYVTCKSTMTSKSAWFSRKIPARGRAMIDPVGMSLVNPNSSYVHEQRGMEANDTVDLTGFTDKRYALIDPYLQGFSFVAKQWGDFHAGDIEEISFREDAFEQLVMEKEDKALILSLVKHVDPTKVTDFIDGKGGGCAFLFHGKPGLGKTLTAEAVAETVKRPLYAASVGELGVDVESLEKNLQVILQLAARWNAVLLLDEADIFLEERSRGDIHRNAMVGTFLRLLEYYNGILILTSNRVKSIDPAFYSRISFARKYKEHDDSVRTKIIRNLLKVNEIELSESDMTTLAAHDVNGRQFKNSIRLARFLAESEHRKVTMRDIDAILTRVQSFAKELTDEVGVKDWD